jgi:hypothetical protein
VQSQGAFWNYSRRMEETKSVQPRRATKSIVAIASRRACDCLPLFEARRSVDLSQIGTLPINFGCTA